MKGQTNHRVLELGKVWQGWGFLRLVLLVALLLALVRIPAYASPDPDWYDTSWAYRKPITISGSTSDQTNYQVEVTVSFVTGKMNSDFSDIRFTSSNGTTLIDHWRESYTASSTADFWVEVPSIPTSGTTIYMYYGNPSASSASSKENTMGIVDKQVGASSDDAHEDGDGWMNLTTNGLCNEPPIWGGFRFTTIGIPQGAAIDVATMEIYATWDGYIVANIYCEDLDDAVAFAGGDPNMHNISSRTRTIAYTNWDEDVVTDGGVWMASPSLVGPVQEVIYRSGWSSGNDIVFIWDGLTGADVEIRSYDGSTTNAAKLHIEYRKYVSPEPSASVGSEETAAGADLAVSKSDSPDPVIAGETLTYTLSITNSGPSDATGVTVTDTLPSEVTFGSTSSGCAYDSVTHKVTCTLGTLNNGATVTATIVVTVDSSTTGTITNTATVTATTTDPDTADNTATEETTVPDWYDASWGYRRAITLSPATSVADYQVPITLTTATMGSPYANVNADGWDIRFTGSDGTTLQDYWIESWDRYGNSRIWVEVKTSETSTIYIYYGNPSASSASSKENTMGIVDKQVAASSDDADDPGDGWPSTTETILYLNAGNKWGGFRFTNVGIPQGATIDVATMEVYKLWATNAKYNIYCEDVDDAVTFTTDQYNISGRTRTTEYTYWNETVSEDEEWYTTPSLVNPVQEVINRPGWSSGNDIVFIWDGLTGANVEIRSYDGSTTNAAKLHIEYRKYVSPEPSASVGSEEAPPSVDSVALAQTAMTPQTEYTVSVSVSDANGKSDLTTVVLKVYYDGDGGTPTEGEAEGQTADTQTCAIITWTQSSDTFAINPSTDTSWSLGTCSSPGSLPGDFTFKFTVGKVATQAVGGAAPNPRWQITAKVTDDSGLTDFGYDSYDSEGAGMNWYGEITVNTGSVNWGTVALGSGFDANSQTDISVTYICNGAYNQQVKADGSWTNGGGASVALSGADPGAGEFSLKADVDATLDGADLVSTDTDWVTIDSGSQTGEGGNTESANTLWLKLGSSGIPDVTYSGDIHYRIAQ